VGGRAVAIPQPAALLEAAERRLARLRGVPYLKTAHGGTDVHGYGFYARDGGVAGGRALAVGGGTGGGDASTCALVQAAAHLPDPGAVEAAVREAADAAEVAGPSVRHDGVSARGGAERGELWQPLRVGEAGGGRRVAVAAGLVARAPPPQAAPVPPPPPPPRPSNEELLRAMLARNRHPLADGVRGRK